MNSKLHLLRVLFQVKLQGRSRNLSDDDGKEILIIYQIPWLSCCEQLQANFRCYQAPSEILQLMILLRHSHNLKSKHDGPREEEGTQRKRWVTLQTLKQLLSKCSSTWESSSKASLSWTLDIFSIWKDKKETKKQRSAPSRRAKKF